MILTITNTQAPAGDLGYLLHKHPARTQTFRLNAGQAHVFYPEAGEDRCTAALLLDIDPVSLVRGRRGSAGKDFALQQYVNDRPYAASSFLSVAIAEVFTSALNGRCKDRPGLVDQPLALEARIAVLPCRGGEDLLRRLFEPLGYEVTAEPIELDPSFPEWGMSRYLTVEVRGKLPLRDLLAHLYVLIPVLDDEKHYWVSQDEVEKLLRHGERWLPNHPERELIARRYLRHQRSLAGTLLAHLEKDEEPAPDERAIRNDREEAAVEAKMGLHAERLATVAGELKRSGASRVLDVGCGEGKLMEMLLKEPAFTEILGMDVASRPLEMAAERMRRLPEMMEKRARLIQGSLMYRDSRLAGYDAAAVVEVIEHLEENRLKDFERALFEFARPGVVVVTTPNSEYNVMWPSLPAGRFRHRDHRFEWTREQFETWARALAGRHGYSVRFAPVGPVEPALGAPTQMGVFSRE